ncbi:unnamed protein product [Sphagnum jensenii]|uniref:Uncharacterized protein n=1 Tax=Sphagnum jensenii TaxID=128206 RepID=A0ABP0VF78_9BRYO
MDSTLASVNNELTPPGRLIAASTPSLVVTVGSSSVVNPNTSKNRVLPFINNVPVAFAGGTITFPSTSGTITVSPGTNGTITIGANQFVAVLVQLSSSGQMSLVTGAAAGSLGAVVIPAGSINLLSLGSAATLQAADILGGVVRLTNGSLVSVSGIPAGAAGQVLIVENKTGATITINNDDAGASAANRIFTGSAGVSMPNNATFAFTYDAVSTHWMLTGGSGSGSGSGGSKNYLSAVVTSQSTRQTRAMVTLSLAQRLDLA